MPKKRAGVKRYPSGQIVHSERVPIETAQDAMKVAQANRIKHCGATDDNWRDQKHENPLGTMRHWAIETRDDANGLSERQHSAMLTYVRERHRSRMIDGFAGESPKSIGANFVPADTGEGVIVDDETAYRARSAYNAARSAVRDHAGFGVQLLKLCDDAARDFGDVGYWRPRLGHLRMAANILARHYRL